MNRNSASPPIRRLAIVGAGLTGLVAADALRVAAPDVELTLFEAADRPGGVLWTQSTADHVVERGADSFLTDSPEALALCERLGLTDQLITLAPDCRRAMVVREGRLVAIPEGWSLMATTSWSKLWTSPLLSTRGALRVLAERFVPRRREDRDESLASFAVRRIGREAYERLAQPLAAGIYTADPERLSMAAALPRWWDMERTHGSLSAALAAEARGRGSMETAGARYGLFATPRGGLGQIIDALVRRLPTGTLRLATLVDSVRHDGSSWQVRCESSSGRATEPFDALALCLPAPQAARLLSETAAELSGALAGMRYADSAIVLLRYDVAQVKSLPRAAGFVVPLIERRKILAASFSSFKFAERAPQGEATLRVFLGGALDPEILARPDRELEAIAISELAELAGVTGPPRSAEVVRWRQAMPQYEVGHLDRVAAIERLSAALPNFALAGNAYHGVGIAACIRSGQRLTASLKV